MKRMILGVILVLLCTGTCFASDEELDVPGLDELWRQVEEYGVREDQDFQEGIQGLLQQGKDELGGILKSSAATVVKLTAVIMLCSLAQTGNEPVRAVEMAGALAITALTMTDMEGMLGLGRQTIGRMDGFSKLLLPVMGILTAATGGITAAAVRQGITVLFSQLLLTAMDRLLIPLIYAYVAISCASAAFGNAGLEKLAGLIRGTATILLTGFLLSFVGYLTAAGAVAGGTDAAAVKAARMAITRVIPVVGGILADASETVLAGTAVLRGSVGAAGMLVVVAICITPFLHLAVHYLAYKITSALCGMIAQPALSRLIDAIGSAFGIVLGMTGAAALVLLVSLVSALTAVIP